MTRLAEAQRALVLGEPAVARRLVRDAAPSTLGPLRRAITAGPGRRRGRRGGPGPFALEIARAATWTAILGEAARRAHAATAAGDVETARAWLLVREFRKPTRFTRPGADATLALAALEEGRLAADAAAAAVRADLLDTYQARLRAALESVSAAGGEGFDISRSGAAALARGYFDVLSPAYLNSARPRRKPRRRRRSRTRRGRAAGRRRSG